MLSTTQKKLLAAIVEEYDRAVKREAYLWGDKSAARVAKRGIDPALIMGSLGARPASIHALGTAGAITWTSAARTFSNVLRKGAYGRRLGGTRDNNYTQFMVVPTDAGRKMI